MLYKKVIRPLLFKIDPEQIHYLMVRIFQLLSYSKILFKFFKRIFFISDPRLNVNLGALKLSNPIGLAAGFDKNVEAPLAYPMFGFGFAELGSITLKAQPGNSRPRLWRIPKDHGLIVNHGLSNDGVDKALENLQKIKIHPVPLGISIAPTTSLNINEMADDYLKTFLKIYNLVDYITLNVSCPNVARCEQFARISFIKELLAKVRQAKEENKIIKDVYIKIGPHFKNEELDEIIEACLVNGITGIVAINLIKDRSGVNFKSNKEELDHPGGVSGPLLKDKSNQVISYIYKKTSGRLKIIGVGGIFTAEDAYQKIKCGASAVQMITGWIYGGPWTIKKINKNLAELVKKDGFKNIGEAVGKGV